MSATAAATYPIARRVRRVFASIGVGGGGIPDANAKCAKRARDCGAHVRSFVWFGFRFFPSSFVAGRDSSFYKRLARLYSLNSLFRFPRASLFLSSRARDGAVRADGRKCATDGVRRDD